MKKTRFIFLIMILTLAFGCSVFAGEMVGEKANPENPYDGFYFASWTDYSRNYADYYTETPALFFKVGNSLYIYFSQSVTSLNIYYPTFDPKYGTSSVYSKTINVNSSYFYENGALYNEVTNLGNMCGYYYDFEFDSVDSMKAYISENKDSLVDSDGNIIIPEPEPPKEVLPNFTYKVSKKWHPHWTTNILQYNLYANWNAKEFERFSDSPNNYYVECKAKVQTSSLNTSDSILIDKQPIVSEEISFSIDDVLDKLLNNPLPDAPGQPDMYIPYYVMLRVVSADDTLCSDWHFYLVEPQSGNRITDSGSFSENDSGDLDITVPPTDNDSSNIDNSNFTKDENGGNTSASRNPDSSVYKETSSVDSQSLVSNLKASVQSIKDISNMLSVCYQWLPSWLLSLIACSIGIVVVVGLVNIIRG